VKVLTFGAGLRSPHQQQPADLKLARDTILIMADGATLLTGDDGY